MNVSVFGLGYVGTVTAVSLADSGHRVIGVEVNPEKLASFRAGECPLFEPGLAPMLAKAHRAGTFVATGSAAEAVESSDLSFICVGTPSQRNGHADLSHVQHVSREISHALSTKTTPHTVAVRSTMLPGSIEDIVAPCLPGARIVANPEFMREGSALRDFREPPFVIIGESAPGDGDALAELYRCVNAPQVRVSLRAAEAIKFACNAFHALKVTFANEMGQFCKAHGIDSLEVMDILCRDNKLNISRTYLTPGMAFGGSCLPKDLRALTGRARERDLELPMVEAIGRSNLLQIQRTIELVIELGHRDVGILGLSFKAGTDDLRESPVVMMAETLLGKGLRLRIHDSEVELTRLVGANKLFLEEKLPHISGLLEPSLEEVVARSSVLVVCKNASEYRQLPRLEQPVVDLVAALRHADLPNYHGLYW
jgi:GDP-mannose 6-dehydrogenase